MYRFDSPSHWDPRYQDHIIDPRFHQQQPRPVVLNRPPVPQYITTTDRPPHRRSKSAKRHQSPERSNSRRRHGAEEDPLMNWKEWRKSINNDLGRDLVRNTYRPIPVGKEFDDLIRPSSKSKRGVYQYSSTIDQATQLHKEDFVNFGIPRAQISHSTPKRDSRRSNNVSDDSDSDETEAPFYSINRIAGSAHRYGPQQNGGHRERIRYRENSEERRGRSHREYRHISPEIIVEGRRHRSYR